MIRNIIVGILTFGVLIFIGYIVQKVKKNNYLITLCIFNKMIIKYEGEILNGSINKKNSIIFGNELE